MDSCNHFVYILECSDGTFYTGYTNDLQNRLKTHNSGKGAKYTRTRIPCKIVYYEIFSDKSSAMKREYQIKHNLTRKDKETLIRSNQYHG